MTHAQPQKKSVFNMNVDLMHGPILKSLLLFMLPILISNLFQQLYNTVDHVGCRKLCQQRGFLRRSARSVPLSTCSSAYS